MSAMSVFLSKMNYFGSDPQFYVGDVVYNAGGRYGPRLQTNLQLVYIHAGEATIFVDGVERHLDQQEATLLLPGHREEFRFSTTGQTHHGWCEVRSPKLEPAVTALYASLPVAVTFGERLTRLAGMALSLRHDTRPVTSVLRDTLARAVFLDFFREAGLLDTAVPVVPEPVARARRHIERHHDQPCDLELLGKVAGVTPAHLIRVFRQHLEVTPIEFLWRARVEAAKRLLADSGLGIAEIAYRTGFQSPYHFSRLIRKHLGMSPRQYRQATWSASKTKKPAPPRQGRDGACVSNRLHHASHR